MLYEVVRKIDNDSDLCSVKLVSQKQRDIDLDACIAFA
jgi:hypothetical protein